MNSVSRRSRINRCLNRCVSRVRAFLAVVIDEEDVMCRLVGLAGVTDEDGVGKR